MQNLTTFSRHVEKQPQGFNRKLFALTLQLVQALILLTENWNDKINVKDLQMLMTA